MESILHDFGINPLLLSAQVVNFLVLLFILKKILYKPMLKMLEERKTKIALSMKQAEETRQTLLKTEEEKEKKLIKATEEAKRIIAESAEEATHIIQEAHTKAQGDIEEMLKKGQESLNRERELLQQEMKEELSDIVAIALEKVTGKVLDQKDQKELIERSIRNLK